jgi:glycosyltransferase involved in cell wall biosynthesis
MRSALAQESVSFELLVVGDGVGDDTRAALEEFLDDPRVSFLDFEKGERNGERHRHVALQQGRGEIVCYLSDDDVLFPGHVAEMRRLLEDADFAHSTPAIVHPDGRLEYRPSDLARPEFLALIREGRNNFIGLTGAAHTRSAYDRLPHGWRPAPQGTPTDIHMWMQMTALPGFSGVTARRLTAVHFPDPAWRSVDDATRVDALTSWLERASRPGGEDEIQHLLEDAVRRAAQDFKLRSIALDRQLEDACRELEQLRVPAWTRVGRRTMRFGPARTLRERLRRKG